MRQCLLLFLMSAALTSVQISAQAKLKDSRDCRKLVGVTDADRRGFDFRGSFEVDIDGDGRFDKIIPRIYSVKNPRTKNRKSKETTTETHWITFDIHLSSGRIIKSFFKYRYGSRIHDEDVDYWVYALVPCRMSREKRVNLFFYSGDDTSEEKIILLNRGINFKVYSRKENGLGE